MSPSMITGLRHAEHARHCGDREDGLIRAHELEDPGGTAPVSRANQAAARERMSRSTRSCLFSRRSRTNSSRSAATQGLALSSAAFMAINLRDPIADRLRCRFKLAGQFLRIPANADQIDHLTTELRGIRRTGSGHLMSLL